jgi:hypothetical protein
MCVLVHYVIIWLICDALSTARSCSIGNKIIGYEWAIGEGMGGSGHKQPCLEKLNKTTKASFKAECISQVSMATHVFFVSSELFGVCGCNL